MAPEVFYIVYKMFTHCFRPKVSKRIIPIISSGSEPEIAMKARFGFIQYYNDTLEFKELIFRKTLINSEFSALYHKLSLIIQVTSPTW